MFSEQDKKVLQVILVIAVIAGLGLFYYSWAVVKYEVRRLDSDIKKYQQDKKTKQTQLRELKKWEGREAVIEQMAAELKRRVQRLPTSPEAREFYAILRQCIGMANLSEITKIVRTKGTDLGSDVAEIPYQITCRAGYHDLGKFLELVEQHPKQIIRLKSLDVQTDLKRPTQHKVSLEVATFVFTRPVPKAKKGATR